VYFGKHGVTVEKEVERVEERGSKEELVGVVGVESRVRKLSFLKIC